MFGLLFYPIVKKKKQYFVTSTLQCPDYVKEEGEREEKRSN